jgi:mRNA interferase MazF
MRSIHLARLDKSRPVLVLTRELVRPHLGTVTIAPITTTVRGLSTEVPCGVENGLERSSAVACDHITTIPVGNLGRQIGRLLDHQELALARAIQAAFDLADRMAAAPPNAIHNMYYVTEP